MSSSDTCTRCSVLNGQTLWRDGHVTNHTDLFIRTSILMVDPMWNETCSQGQQCVAGEELQLKMDGIHTINTSSNAGAEEGEAVGDLEGELVAGIVNSTSGTNVSSTSGVNASDVDVGSLVGEVEALQDEFVGAAASTGVRSTPHTSGCCVPCVFGQYCPAGSIAVSGSLFKSNVCPDGNICDYESGITQCPAGTLCYNNATLNCTDAISRSVWYELLVGTTCPAGSARLQMCPSGRYCETPAIVRKCSAGFFCMAKSAEMWLASPCPEGSTTLCVSRKATMVVIVVACVLAILVAVRVALEKRREKRDSAAAAAGTDAKSGGVVKETNLARLEHAVGKFLRHSADRNQRGNKSFADMDEADKGYLTYDEIRENVDLTELQYARFKQLMQNEAGSSEGDKIGKTLFNRHVANFLYMSSRIDPSEQDVVDLYKELDQNDDGVLSGDELYGSILTTFLDDAEINDLLKEFREVHKDDDAQVDPGAEIKITKSEFLKHYPTILKEVTTKSSEISQRGMDIAFQGLTLSVELPGGKKKNVVDNISGRLREKTMTALMGGSGAGKTSLLNALCGRAFYGTVSGKLFINGNEGNIDDIKARTGFVPQDDIVYAELTVLENFLFAGQFRLPRGTTRLQLHDLADQVVAGLGLMRVKNNVVGDVTRRGLSGGEKKRVNIGLELMARPSLLFLDEPTSGLDSSSSLLVMNRLKALTQKHRMTICSVIHQPRKCIFDSFDDVILLNFGGRLVYEGPTKDAAEYFENLGYTMPSGENVADWIIDISTGSLEAEESNGTSVVKTSFTSDRLTKDSEKLARERRDTLNLQWKTHFDGLSMAERTKYDPPEEYRISFAKGRVSFGKQTWLQLKRRLLVMRRNRKSHLIDALIVIIGMVVMAAVSGVLVPVDDTRLGTVTYQDLEASLIPEISQTGSNVLRTTAQLCQLAGNTDQQDIVMDMIQYALAGYGQVVPFGMMTAGVVSVLVSISATKMIRQKRLEFFRESGSGYNIWAFFLAISSLSTIEFSLQVIVGGLLAIWIRVSMVSVWAFLVNVVLLAWMSSAWGIFYSTWVPPDSLSLVTGFHMFLSIFLSGAVGVKGLSYKDYHAKPVLNAIMGFISPARSFIEAYIVGEYKCLKPQSGFTSKTLRFVGSTGFDILGLGQNDPNVAVRSCSGWYWNFLPMFLFGLTIRIISGGVLTAVNRDKMPKTGIIHSLSTQRTFLIYAVLYVLLVIGLLAVSIWSFVAVRGSPKEVMTREDFFCSLMKNQGVDASECDQLLQSYPLDQTEEAGSLTDFCASLQ